MWACTTPPSKSAIGIRPALVMNVPDWREYWFKTYQAAPMVGCPAKGNSSFVVKISITHSEFLFTFPFPFRIPFSRNFVWRGGGDWCS